eukprot:CAMPEP_0202836278 /NCGR_PEP_ID=MMETSP1389-20130828/40573_1 /ASSEMBLY_ACC=CAM_ASM_000865 /TAXON_ID=302021 /ORGANISM="Rhodomonas sp., Strain CCMP768" /LENGTH=69 /DNA_ID=CAMNT_0049512019 /DNA_START=106 /DNA_END=311 /DNA_ORIENTATION=+
MTLSNTRSHAMFLSFKEEFQLLSPFGGFGKTRLESPTSSNNRGPMSFRASNLVFASRQPPIRPQETELS